MDSKLQKLEERLKRLEDKFTSYRMAGDKIYHAIGGIKAIIEEIKKNDRTGKSRSILRKM